MARQFSRPEVPLPHTTADDPRIGQLLSENLETAHVVLVGFPSDEGVRRNGGRTGAAHGPPAIRQALFRMTPAPSFVPLLAGTTDLGDFVVSGDLERDQEEFGREIAPLLRAGKTLIILGGGHETAYGHFLGYVAAEKAVTIVNIDAHPDVRELRDGKGHSGSPFRQAVLHPSKLCRKYSVYGLLPHSSAEAHRLFVTEHGGSAVMNDEVTRESRLFHSHSPCTMASFDLDAVDGAFAPGVSAPASEGMGVSTWLSLAEQAGRSPTVQSVDIVELNPDYDRDGQTARLAALTVWRFLQGMTFRV